MSTDTAVTVLTWVLVLTGASALVAIVALRSWAMRLLVVGAAGLLLLAAWAARTQIDAIAQDSPEALCVGGVRWLGMELTGSDEVCSRFR